MAPRIPRLKRLRSRRRSGAADASASAAGQAPPAGGGPVGAGKPAERERATAEQPRAPKPEPAKEAPTKAPDPTADTGAAATKEPGAAGAAAKPAPKGEGAGHRRRRAAGLVGAGLLAIAAGLGGGYLIWGQDEKADAPATAAAPQVIVEQAPESDSDASSELGFPAFATRNTTRISGSDATTDAAGVALATFPTAGDVSPPVAAILASSDSWQEALAATPLAAEPIDAPVLLATRGEVPELTADALDQLDPPGLGSVEGPAKDAQVIAVGDVAKPDGFQTYAIDDSDPAKLAQSIDQELSEITGADDPEHLLVVSSEDSALAMPAAAWAARSGDPILFAAGSEVPEETLAVLDRHPKTPVYVLGGSATISASAIKDLEKAGSQVTRVGTDEPVSNAIDFARFVDGSFGWNINDPGHGFVIANTDRPLDAPAGAALSAGGTPGPLLLTDDAQELPDELRAFLLDTKPGYEDDPTRAVYNRVWLLGDQSAISVAQQSQIDELTTLVPIRAGTTGPQFGPGPAPGTPESEDKGGKP